MRDTDHCKINLDDIIEHFYKFYDKNLLKEAPERERKTKHFKLLKRILLPKNKKEIIEEDEEVEEVEEIDEKDIIEEEVKTNKKEKENIKEEDLEGSEYDEDDLEEINYVTMDNGEIMLRDGTVVGNKIYKTAYKQRVRMELASWKTNSQVGFMRIRMQSRAREMNKMVNKKGKYSHWSIKGSKKSNFNRVNTLLIIRKQVNC